MKKHLNLILYILSILTPVSIEAQRHEIISQRIKTLQVVADGDWLQLPVTELGRGEITIDFDDLTHEYNRYTYTLQHCEADWQPSVALFEADFVDGFASGNTIDNFQQSEFTNTLYTHYRITIPNERCKPRISGNYILTVLDDNDEPVLKACFMLTEPKDRMMHLGLAATSNTDATVNRAHQQVEMTLAYGSYRVTDPAKQIKTVLLQNKRWSDARINIKPQFSTVDGMRWSHCKDHIFLAGNEYRKFEILSTKVASMGIERVAWDGQNYNAFPFIATEQPNYLSERDADGAFCIRNSDNWNNNTASDYLIVNFRFDSPQPLKEEIYLNADWTYDRLMPEYRLSYDAEARQYKTAILLKMGYYNYRFIQLDSRNNARPLETDGNFWQTENTYQAFVYYRSSAARTDQLVAYTTIKTP